MKDARTAAARLRDRLLDVITADDANDDVKSWRMQVMLGWWLDQMVIATDGDIDTIIGVLLAALNHAGIETHAALVGRSETVQ